MFDEIDIDSLSEAIYDAVSYEFTKVNKKINSGISRISRETKEKVKEKSPVYKGKSKKLEKGRYQKGWEITTLKRNGTLRKTLHNKEYQLVHLLELGHDLKDENGIKYGEVKAYPHVEKAQEYANSEVDKLIEESQNK